MGNKPQTGPKRRSSVRGLEGRLGSQILRLFARQSKAVNHLIPQLYLHELALGTLTWRPKALAENQ